MNTVDFRRHLHSHPELSFEEHSTAAFISEQLDALGIEHRPIAGTGILARIEGRRGNLKRCVVLRADIDALPLQELTGVEWASQCDGVMHGCGHDCHAAILYGVLKRLQLDRDFEGTVLGLFQPAEERGFAGARKVLEEDPFKEYDVAAVIGEHVDADLEVGELGFCPGKFMASADELHFTVKSGAATGRVAKSPIVAAADLIMRLNAFNSDVCKVSVYRTVADGIADHMAEECRVEAMMRTYDEKLRGRIKDMIAHATEEVEYKYDVEVDTDIHHGYPCVENDTQLTYEAMLLADSHGYVVRDLERIGGEEDFGCYSQLYPSLYYRLGVSRAAGRKHTATFLPDERALAVGEEFMYQLSLSILNK
ncbi:MAG: amidohydrolase [Alistipes sp.]|nr:amidohydrolase [Alistipes sp.]